MTKKRCILSQVLFFFPPFLFLSSFSHNHFSGVDGTWREQSSQKHLPNWIGLFFFLFLSFFFLSLFLSQKPLSFPPKSALMIGCFLVVLLLFIMEELGQPQLDFNLEDPRYVHNNSTSLRPQSPITCLPFFFFFVGHYSLFRRSAILG